MSDKIFSNAYSAFSKEDIYNDFCLCTVGWLRSWWSDEEAFQKLQEVVQVFGAEK